MASQPLLAVDIDGVISLFASEDDPERPATPGRHEWLLIDGIPHCISLPAGERLRRLSDSFELFWASGWEDRANDHLPNLLGLPQLPHLELDTAPKAGGAHWKLAALERHVGDRPLAWIDDNLDESCFSWADRRPFPTLLVPTDPHLGLEEGHVAALEAWAIDIR